ncbi:MAG: xanthine dehydrogenase family protein molybdopterin-binding subunit, partial [Ilumatobacteraceae bacterium]
MATAGSILGNAVQRLEDPTLLTGAGKYLDDMTPTGMLHVSFVRSTQAHAKVTGVDIAAAAAMPGVKAVYHAAGNDLGLTSFNGFPMMPPELNRPIFAKDVVRFVGDIVAAVVATSKAAATDAAEAVIVDHEALQAIVTPAQGLMPDAPILFPEHGSNVCFGTEHGADVDPFEGADEIAEVTMVSQRLAGAPMETNGILVEPGDKPGTLTCWISHQTPHSAQEAIAAVLGMERGDLHVICPWVGGGFGPKAAIYPEYLIAAAACRDLGAPVKWAETRSEDMVSLVHGRDYVMTAKLGVTKDGKFTGLEGDVTANAGAYPAIGAILPLLTQMMSVGVYDIDKVKFVTRSVLTNTTTVGAYRGAGRPEATQLIERVIDVAAHKIGMDPAELRRRNFFQPGAFPLTTNTGGSYDSGEYEKALDAVLAASGYKELREEQARRR